MLKQAITYVDPWTNLKVTNDFYFHFTEAELLRLINTHKGDLTSDMQLVSSGNATPKQILAIFEEFISKSYGERTDDGRFVKNQDTVDAFLVSEPYSSLIFSFFNEDDGGTKASDFLNGLMPPDLVARVNANQAVKSPSDKPSEERVAELRAKLSAPVEGMSRPSVPTVFPTKEPDANE